MFTIANSLCGATAPGVVCDLLSLYESVYQEVRWFAEKWRREPSVHGCKARPKDAEFET